MNQETLRQAADLEIEQNPSFAQGITSDIYDACIRHVQDIEEAPEP